MIWYVIWFICVIIGWKSIISDRWSWIGDFMLLILTPISFIVPLLSICFCSLCFNYDIPVFEEKIETYAKIDESDKTLKFYNKVNDEKISLSNDHTNYVKEEYENYVIVKENTLTKDMWFYVFVGPFLVEIKKLHMKYIQQ